MVRKFIIILFGALVLLLSVLLFNTLRYQSVQEKVEPVQAIAISSDAIARFQQALHFKTISYGDISEVDTTQFLNFHKFLQTAYPLTHARLSRETVEHFSLLYRWEGSDPSLNPAILMAHQDVVPIEAETIKLWSVDPFGGEIKDDFIWGRGTTDDKINLISIFEAIEILLANHFQPKRTLYLALGHDEEVGGRGARAIAALLQLRKITADFILDEGGIITRDKVPGLNKPVALIGTSEKGYLSLELRVEKSGGHSSQPEKETAIDILSSALIKIRENPFEAAFSESTQGLLNHIGPEMPFLKRIAFANQWLFKSLIISTYEKSPGGNAMVRTTGVTTIINAGIKDNVVPTVAEAIVNFRLLPGDQSTEVIERVRKIVNDDRVTMGVLHSFISEASPVTPENSYAFKRVSQTIRSLSTETIAAPFLMIGGTDSRFFGGVSKNIIKFSPMVDPVGFHGIDERVSLESYTLSIGFYNQLIIALQEK